MTPHPAVTDSPWQRIARDAAREWFRDNPAAPWTDFYQWTAEEWEPREFFAAGFGWRPGDPVNRDALAAAHVGLALAVEDEEVRRLGRNPRQEGASGPLERLAGPGGVSPAPLWGLEDGAA